MKPLGYELSSQVAVQVKQPAHDLWIGPDFTGKHLVHGLGQAPPGLASTMIATSTGGQKPGKPVGVLRREDDNRIHARSQRLHRATVAFHEIGIDKHDVMRLELLVDYVEIGFCPQHLDKLLSMAGVW